MPWCSKNSASVAWMSSRHKHMCIAELQMNSRKSVRRLRPPRFMPKTLMRGICCHLGAATAASSGAAEVCSASAEGRPRGLKTGRLPSSTRCRGMYGLRLGKKASSRSHACCCCTSCTYSSSSSVGSSSQSVGCGDGGTLDLLRGCI
eukprot:3004366-Amphidinium_carterae.1